MPITPDAKDWTWVLERGCPECGFESAVVAREEIAPLIRDNATRWQEILGERSRLSERPTDDRWSAVEYACHVRDVFRIYDQRLRLMRTENAPTFPNWDQDVTAVEQHYNDQDPQHVARELAGAAQELAADFEDVADDEWLRSGTRSDGVHFTIDTFARYMVHDPVHHLHDVEVGLEALESRS